MLGDVREDAVEDEVELQVGIQVSEFIFVVVLDDLELVLVEVHFCEGLDGAEASNCEVVLPF